MHIRRPGKLIRTKKRHHNNEERYYYNILVKESSANEPLREILKYLKYHKISDEYNCQKLYIRLAYIDDIYQHLYENDVTFQDNDYAIIHQAKKYAQGIIDEAFVTSDKKRFNQEERYYYNKLQNLANSLANRKKGMKGRTIGKKLERILNYLNHHKISNEDNCKKLFERLNDIPHIYKQLCYKDELFLHKKYVTLPENEKYAQGIINNILNKYKPIVYKPFLKKRNTRTSVQPDSKTSNLETTRFSLTLVTFFTNLFYNLLRNIHNRSRFSFSIFNSKPRQDIIFDKNRCIMNL